VTTGRQGELSVSAVAKRLGVSTVQVRRLDSKLRPTRDERGHRHYSPARVAAYQHESAIKTGQRRVELLTRGYLPAADVAAGLGIDVAELARRAPTIAIGGGERMIRRDAAELIAGQIAATATSSSERTA
jgi:hypothetical protein